LALVLVLGAIGVVAARRDTGPSGPTLYAYGTSYLAADVVNSPGRRYIDQFDDKLQPSQFQNLAKSGATVQDIAATVDRTWKPRQAIVVIDAVTNNLYQTRTNPAQGIADAEPVFKSMLQRLGPMPSIIVVKQGHLSAHDYALFDDLLSDATVDAWNAMIDRDVAGLPNVRVVDPNVGWDPNTMINNVHPTDAGEDHIAQQLCAASGLPWRLPNNDQ
jgi:predicted RNA-binding Zn ribbon-like protein